VRTRERGPKGAISGESNGTIAPILGLMEVAAPRTVTESVAEQLRLMIHQGELGPGDVLLPEAELAQAMGVGRVTLRAALKRLGHSGYIQVRRGARGGAFVTELEAPYTEWAGRMRANRADFDDILDFRIAVESRAAQLAAERRTRQDLLAQERAIRDIGMALGRASFRRADSTFHVAVARAARSPRLEVAMRRGRGELFVPMDALVYTEQMDSCKSAHESIFVAIRDRDPIRAGAQMAAHIEHTREELSTILDGDSR